MLSRLSEEKFLSHMRETAKHVGKRLAELPEMFPTLLQPTVRGRGLILGLPFKNGDDPARLMKLARERGILLLTAGKDAVRLLPSLNVSKEEADLALVVMSNAVDMSSLSWFRKLGVVIGYAKVGWFHVKECLCCPIPHLGIFCSPESVWCRDSSYVIL